MQLKQKIKIAIISTIALGAFLRILNLGFQSFWYEELMVLSYSKADSFFSYLKNYLSTPDAAPPFFSAIIYFLRQLGVNSEFGLRLPSAIFGILSIHMVYLIGKKMSNTYVGISAALMTATSGALIYYSQELRYNSMLIYFILLFSWLSLSFTELTKKKVILWYFSILTLSLVHYIGLYFILQILVVLFISSNDKKKLLKKLILPIAVIALTLLPFINIFIKLLVHWSVPTAITNTPDLPQYLWKFLNFTFFYRSYWNPEISHPLWIEIWRYTFYFFILVSIFFLLFKEIKKNPQYSKKILRHTNFLKDYFLIGIFLANLYFLYFFEFFTGRRFFNEKNVLFLVPFLYISLSCLIFKIFPKKVSFFLVFIIAIQLPFRSFFLQNYYTSPYKTEFKQAAEKMASKNELAKFYLCGDPRWYQYYNERFELKNVYFIHSQEQFELKVSELKKSGQKDFWVHFAHCMVEFSYENHLETYPVIEKYKSHSLMYLRQLQTLNH